MRLAGVEIQQTDDELAAAIGDSGDKLPSGAVKDFRILDGCLDDSGVSRNEIADESQAGFIFPAKGQMQRQVFIAVQSKFAEFAFDRFGNRKGKAHWFVIVRWTISQSP